MMTMQRIYITPCRALFLVLMTHSLSAMAFSHFSEFGTISERRIKDDMVFIEIHSASLLRCAAMCTMNGSCTRASYHEIKGSCRMLKERLSTDDLVYGSEWTTVFKKGCPDGWVEIEDICYLFGKEERNYYEAKTSCEENHGKLAEPRTETAIQLLRDHILKHGDHACHYWIGVTDRNSEGSYRWESDPGTSPLYTDWAHLEPWPGSTYNCVRYKTRIYMGSSYLILIVSSPNCEAKHQTHFKHGEIRKQWYVEQLYKVWWNGMCFRKAFNGS